MYDKEFISRVNIRQIREFFQNGSETFENEEGTPSERYFRYVDGMTAATKKFRDDVIHLELGKLSAKERDSKSEELWQDIFVQSENLNKLSFEMGYCAGIKNGIEMNGYSDIS